MAGQQGHAEAPSAPVSMMLGHLIGFKHRIQARTGAGYSRPERRRADSGLL